MSYENCTYTKRKQTQRKRIWGRILEKRYLNKEIPNTTTAL